MSIRKNIFSKKPSADDTPDSVNHDESQFAKFKDFMDHYPDGFFQTSLDGQFLYANQSFAKMLGYDSRNDLMKLKVIDDIYLYADERKELLKLLERQRRVKNYKLKLKKKDGSEIVVKLNDRLVTDEDDKPLYYEGSIQDITQQVKIEDEKKKELDSLRAEKKKAVSEVSTAVYTSNVKSQFLASMSHEIKTPINSIVGFLTLVEQELFQSEEELKDFAQNARVSADSLLEIINNILDISKIEAGKIELDDVEFDLKEEVEKAKSILTPVALEKELKINISVDENIVSPLIGDPTRYRQVLVNLLSNAVKNSEKGEVEIKVEQLKKTEATLEVKTSVIDIGIGIPKEKLPLLFKPYTQIKGKKWDKKGGTGLGLMISKEFVNLMGGDISISSEEGKGTQVNFTVRLKHKKDFLVPKEILEKDEKQEKPDTVIESTGEKTELEIPETVVDSTDEPKKSIETKHEEVIEKIEESTDTDPDANEEVDSSKKEEGLPENGIVGRKKRLLLVEDNPISQKVELKLLTESGYSVEAVSNGFDAIEAVKTNTFHLVLMDIEMADMDGLEATQKIRDLDPPASKIPIIAVTAHSSMKDRDKCLAAGMDDYIAKPININFMKMTIDQWLFKEVHF
ncbi:MAG: response regulator [Melioribacteraceae bacterium]|nr:response regulator [Melioribacteraceae bacterium]